ncbi:hypothetical protein [Cryobacterium sp. Y57]|uniref:phage tail protein n=1 Tax=Cryobacterium sp. Y57 TaxID=2048287 RepID=UPI000CE34969|nr:hypothetical protein [Cryobacterium sp. Y57]
MASLYEAFVDIVPSTRGLKSKLAKEFSDAGPDAGRAAGKGINSGVLGSVGKLAGPLAAAFAGLGIGKIISDSITNASDLAEAGTAITAVFGSADATIQKFAAGSAASLGQSTNQTLDAARVFGVFGKAAGLGGDDLAGFSTDFITLAADLASFNNTTPEAAIEALGAGLRGESEPLRQYGVLLDDAALKARATELGIYSGTGALTAQQKVLASQAEIMAQTGIQQGDFAKTSGGLANQQRILSAGMENLSTTFGAIFLPIATTVVGFLNRSVVPAFQGLAGMLTGGETPAAVAGFMGFFQPLINFFQTSIAPAFALLAPILATLLPQLVTLWEAFSPLSLIFAAIGPQLPGLVLAFAGLAAALAGALGSALVDIMPSITALSGALVAILAGILTNVLPPLIAFAGWLADNVQVVLAFAVAIGAAVIAFQLYTATMAIVRGATVLWAGVQAVLNGVMALNPIGIIVLAIIALVAAIIWVATQTTFFQDAWKVMVDIFVNSIGMFSDFFTNTIGMFVDFFTNTVGMFVDFGVNVVAAVQAMWQSVTQFFSDFIGGAIDLVVGFVSKIIGFYIGLGVSILSTVSDMWSSVTGFFSGFISGAIGLIVNFISSILVRFAAFGSSLVSFFARMWSGVTGAVSTGVENVVGFIRQLPGKVLGVLGNMGSFLVNAGADLIQGFIDGITGMLDNVGDAVGGVMDFVGGFFPHSPAKRGPFSGSGWRDVLTAGEAIGDQFSAGLEDSIPDVGSMLSSVNVGAFTPRVDASVYGSASASGGYGSPGGDSYVFTGPMGLTAADVEAEITKKKRRALASINVRKVGIA